jgi:U3 small nucleolar ribonucleoprotein component
VRGFFRLSFSPSRASKSAPIVTPEYSKSIEDMIIERIKASNFSNVSVQKIVEKQDSRGFELRFFSDSPPRIDRVVTRKERTRFRRGLTV